VGVETAAPALEPGQPDASRRRVTLQRGGGGAEGGSTGRVLLVSSPVSECNHCLRRTFLCEVWICGLPVCSSHVSAICYLRHLLTSGSLDASIPSLGSVGAGPAGQPSYIAKPSICLVNTQCQCHLLRSRAFDVLIR